MQDNNKRINVQPINPTREELQQRQDGQPTVGETRIQFRDEASAKRWLKGTMIQPRMILKVDGSAVVIDKFENAIYHGQFRRDAMERIVPCTLDQNNIVEVLRLDGWGHRWTKQLGLHSVML